MRDNEIKKFRDISKWDDTGSLNGWVCYGIPPRIQISQEILIPILKDIAPMNVDETYARTWKVSKSVTYSVKEGYHFLLRRIQTPDITKLWKSICNNDVIPKVKAFCWTLVHESILITKHEKVGNIHGPSRCVLCKQEEKSIPHVFFSVNLPYLCGLVILDKCIK